MRTWLSGIVLNVVRHHRRTVHRKSPHERSSEPPTDVDSLPTAAPGPDDIASLREGTRLLQQVLDGLDEKKREVLVLAELEGFSSPEIANILGIGVNTVYSRLRLAREEFERLAARCRKARRTEAGMKTELKPENRALFDAGREGLAPTDDNRSRVAKALGLNLGGGAGIASAAAKAIAGLAATSPAAFGISSGVVAAKWVVVVAVVVGVGTGGGALYKAGTARERPQLAAVSAGAESAREPFPPRAAGGARTQVVGEEQPPAAATRASATPASLDPATESPKPADVAPARQVSSSTSLRAPRAGEDPSASERTFLGSEPHGHRAIVSGTFSVRGGCGRDRQRAGRGRGAPAPRSRRCASRRRRGGRRPLAGRACPPLSAWCARRGT